MVSYTLQLIFGRYLYKIDEGNFHVCTFFAKENKYLNFNFALRNLNAI